MFGDTVDRNEQFVHSGNDGNLGTFARGAQAQVIRTEPRIEAYADQDGHPKGASEAGVTEWNSGFAGISLLPGLMKPRNSADITRECRSAAEPSRIACLGDYSGGG